MSNQVTSILTTQIAVPNNNQRLSICLRSNGFSFMLATTDRQLLTFGEADFDFHRPLGELTQSIKDFFLSLGINTFGLKQVSLILHASHFVWIPEHLYDAARDRQYLRMVSSLPADLGSCHVHVPHMKAFMVFSAPTDIVTAFKLAMPGIDVHCQHSRLVTPTLLSRSLQHPLVLMHVGDGFVDFDAFYNGQLLFSNTFASCSDKDCLFHALTIMKQLHLETPDMELAICGNVGREIYAMLQHYFPSVTLHTGDPCTYALPEMRQIPIYRHVLLLG